jgi:hypothetical protein
MAPYHAPDIKTSKMALPKALDDQRELLRVLVADRQATEKKFDQIMRALQDAIIAQGPSDSRSHAGRKSGSLSEPSMTLTVSTSQVDQLSNCQHW